jgi:hypothetical protein
MTGLNKRLGRFVFLFAAAVVTAAGCGDNAAPTAPSTTATVSSVSVTGATTTGLSFQLKATAGMSDGTSSDATATAAWSSSNIGLATVSSTGLVTVVGGGEFDIRATYQTVTGSLHVRLSSVPVSAVTVSGPASSAMAFQLTAAARLSDGSVEDVTRGATWRSSNEQLATVSAGGYVSVVAAGDVDFGATYQGVTGSLRVTLSPPQMYTLSGIVASSDPNARGLAGARIQIFSGTTDHATSDGQGQFALGVVAGRAVIEVSMDGYQTWSREIVIEGDTKILVLLSPMAQPAATGAGDREAPRQ